MTTRTRHFYIFLAVHDTCFVLSAVLVMGDCAPRLILSSDHEELPLFYILLAVSDPRSMPYATTPVVDDPRSTSVYCSQ